MNWSKLFVLIVSILMSCGKSDEPYTIEMKDGVNYIHNHAPLWGDTLKVEIEFVQKIGDFDTEDDNYLLFHPKDVARDKSGNIYVLDAGNYRIQKYDSNGKFISTFGRKGEGPGEIMTPVSIEIDSNDKLHLADLGNNRIQVYNLDGKAAEQFKSKTPIFNFHLLASGNIIVNRTQSKAAAASTEEELKELLEMELYLLEIYDKSGNLLLEFGKEKKYDDYITQLLGNVCIYTSDKQDNIYVAFLYQNRIEKYSPEGKLLFCADRKLNYPENNKVKVKQYLEKGKPETIFVLNIISVNLQIDRKGRLWIATFIKQPDVEGQTENDEQQSDIIQFEIFNSKGILLGCIPYPVSGITEFKRIYGDRMYFVDSQKEMCVYEYKIVEK